MIEKFFSIAEEFVLKGAVCKILEGSAGPPRVADAPRSGRLASDEGSPASSQKKLGLPGRLDFGSLGPPFSGRSSLVVHRGSSRGGCFSVRLLS